MLKDILKLTESIEAEIIQWQQDLHQIPEISYDLSETTAYVEKKLRSFGITSIKIGVGKAGIVVDIDGNGPGKRIALRGDMDGLPVTEDSASPAPSQHPGKMHACGHDGHTAMLMGAAKLLWENRLKFVGSVRLLFQPAEEGPPLGGAHAMVQDGAMDGVDAVYGIHLMAGTGMPIGTVFFAETKMCSALDCFTIEIIGKGGHGSMPQKCVDAITVGAQLVNNLQYVVSRQMDPLEPLVITIGTFNGGTLWNIIAETVKITGTVRSFDQVTREQVIQKIEHCIQSTCAVSGAAYKFKNEPAVAPLVNNADAAHFLKDTLSDFLSEKQIVMLPHPMTGTDDCAYFLEKAPGVYMGLACSSGPETSFEHHSPHFCIDPAALKIGTAIHLSLVNKYLNSDVTFGPNS